MGEPWRPVCTAAIGGLTDVGFSADDRYVLVAGHQGRGVFDCATGERVARESDPHGSCPDEADSTSSGIGPLAGEQIRMAGLMSQGTLPVTTGTWRVVLLPEGLRLTDGERTQLLPVTEELRAFGFGHLGRTLVVATSADLTLLALHEDDR